MTAEKKLNIAAAAHSSNTPLLDKVKVPADMQGFSDEELKILAGELRGEMIDAVSQTGGHLGAGLGVVELSIALHAVFNTPEDRLIWDVGHQCYPHKILTGRRHKIRTIRQGEGLSGFTKRCESEYDPFGAGHSSTSLSAGLGMAIARDLAGGKNNVISVIGDGAMSAGMAYEAMNNAGDMNSRLIVILNDNEMSISPPVGAMSKYLSRMVSSKPYIGTREAAKKFVAMMPPPLKKAAARAEETARVAFSDTIGGGGTFFEEMGFYYVGPLDGHNLDHLLPVLRNLRDTDKGPILLHVITKKGRGYSPAENSADKMHGVSTFDILTGDQKKSVPTAPSYTKIFAKSLIKEAQKDDKIIGITAAMASGTGMDMFGKAFPKRMFDVGIAEQHAVTFAAGLATEGYKPFVAIYSTFLQRAYDQIVHDVCLQNLPVRFAIDRAGLVGADGATHAGSFDVAYLGCLPNMVLMAASDEAELMHMVATAAAYDNGPIAFRYPRGEAAPAALFASSKTRTNPSGLLRNGTGIEIPEKGEVLEIGKGRIVYSSNPSDKNKISSLPGSSGQSIHRPTQKAKMHHPNKSGDDKNTVAILSYGTRLKEALLAADMMEKKNISVTIADARFAKPLDEELIRDLAQNHRQLITIEEGSIGGFGSYVLAFLNRDNLLGTCRVQTMQLPDIFQDHNDPDRQYIDAGLIAKQILKTIEK